MAQLFPAADSRESHFCLFVFLSLRYALCTKMYSVFLCSSDNHTKFGNDRSREYKVTEGRILPCSIGMACRL